ncbi:hypothetical protein Mapa_011341 [Marchantia paleacea]|nr:hypothetical protein Mapa_011341 [Marchantia paleacea]
MYSGDCSTVYIKEMESGLIDYCQRAVLSAWTHEDSVLRSISNTLRNCDGLKRTCDSKTARAWGIMALQFQTHSSSHIYSSPTESPRSGFNIVCFRTFGTQPGVRNGNKFWASTLTCPFGSAKM